MPVWQVQICKNTIWCKIDEIFKKLYNVFGTVDYILTVDHDADGKDNDRMPK